MQVVKQLGVRRVVAGTGVGLLTSPAAWWLLLVGLIMGIFCFWLL